MSDYRKIVNGSEYLFINTFRGNRSGFVHETELMRDNWVIGTNKVQYYNRTWECYTYQTVMKGCVSKLMDEAFEEFKTAWKNAHEIKRLTAKMKNAMMEDLKNNPPMEYAELKELYELL